MPNHQTMRRTVAAMLCSFTRAEGTAICLSIFVISVICVISCNNLCLDSGVGTTLVQYCNSFNLSAFVTAGSKEKIDKCLALGAKGGANYKKEDFSVKLKEMYPSGADIILDCVCFVFTFVHICCVLCAMLS